MLIEHKIGIAIIPKECQERALTAITSVGIENIMSFDARGTAEVALLQQLGLGQTKKTLIAFAIGSADFSLVISAFQSVLNESNHTGIGFVVNMEKSIMDKSGQNLIVCAIVNAGYAESVMQSARKVGARGGTIINARGTGKEQDMDFFGIQIKPEKEMLVMVAESDTAEKIVASIKALPLLANPGSGFVFTVEANSVTRLGGSTT